MTDRAKFKEFFNSMGVQWYFDSKTEITVAQAHFHFDKKGTFLRVEDDKMGGVWARTTPKGESNV